LSGPTFGRQKSEFCTARFANVSGNQGSPCILSVQKYGSFGSFVSQVVTILVNCAVAGLYEAGRAAAKDCSGGREPVVTDHLRVQTAAQRRRIKARRTISIAAARLTKGRRDLDGGLTPAATLLDPFGAQPVWLLPQSSAMCFTPIRRRWSKLPHRVLTIYAQLGQDGQARAVEAARRARTGAPARTPSARTRADRSLDKLGTGSDYTGCQRTAG